MLSVHVVNENNERSHSAWLFFFSRPHERSFSFHSSLCKNRKSAEQRVVSKESLTWCERISSASCFIHHRPTSRICLFKLTSENALIIHAPELSRNKLWQIIPQIVAPVELMIPTLATRNSKLDVTWGYKNNISLNHCRYLIDTRNLIEAELHDKTRDIEDRAECVHTVDWGGQQFRSVLVVWRISVEIEKFLQIFLGSDHSYHSQLKKSFYLTTPWLSTIRLRTSFFDSTYIHFYFS